MKKAKALQDFWYGSEKISKGDVLEYMHPASSWHYRVGTIMIPIYIIENNPHIFECPYEEELTSDEEDEAARRYMWVPKVGENVFRVSCMLNDHAGIVPGNWTGENVFRVSCTLNDHAGIVPENWTGERFGWFCFRHGMVFRTQAEAERAAELLNNGRI